MPARNFVATLKFLDIKLIETDIIRVVMLSGAFTLIFLYSYSYIIAAEKGVDVRLLKDEEAAQQNILATLSWLGAVAGENKSVFFVSFENDQHKPGRGSQIPDIPPPPDIIPPPPDIIEDDVYFDWKNHEDTVYRPYIKTPRVNLRSYYSDLTDDEVKSMLMKYNFFDYYWNKMGDFANNYELKKIEGDKIVIDHATGLMWHQSGTPKNMSWEMAKKWVIKLNNRSYAEYSDWRLPTIEEVASLLESSKKNGDLYIDPVFDDKQRWIWVGDKFGSIGAWVVYFSFGSMHKRDIVNYYHVRTVRSMK